LSHGLPVDDRAPQPAPTIEPEAVLDTVVALITDVIGDEYASGLDIGMDTTFQEDLELESIEFTALAERLMETYGDQVDFMSWLAEMDVDAIIAMTVGELVSFITSSLAGGAGGGDATVAGGAPAGAVAD
jgi:acyl carrier protein